MKRKLCKIYTVILSLSSSRKINIYKKWFRCYTQSYQFLDYIVVKYKSSHPERYIESICIWSFSGLHIPSFGLNTEIYIVSLRIQSKCGKIRTRKTFNTSTLHAAVFYKDAFLKNFKKYKRNESYFQLSCNSESVTTPFQVFPCDFFKSFQNNFYLEQLKALSID